MLLTGTNRQRGCTKGDFGGYQPSYLILANNPVEGGQALSFWSKMYNTVVALTLLHSNNLFNTIISAVHILGKCHYYLCLLDLKHLDLAVHQNFCNMACLARQLTHLNKTLSLDINSFLDPHLSQLCEDRYLNIACGGFCGDRSA